MFSSLLLLWAACSATLVLGAPPMILDSDTLLQNGLDAQALNAQFANITVQDPCSGTSPTMLHVNINPDLYRGFNRWPDGMYQRSSCALSVWKLANAAMLGLTSVLRCAFGEGEGNGASTVPFLAAARSHSFCSVHRMHKSCECRVPDFRRWGKGWCSG